jgi:hypothetical protein
VLGTEPRGGAIVASTPGAASPRWFALTSGVPDDEHAARPGPLALAALGARGELQLVTTALPGDREAIAEGASIAAHGDRVAVLYAHASPEGVTEWRLQRAGCRVPPARVAASSGEPARAGGRNR